MATLKKIFVDSGHSVGDPGAVKYEVERELNLIITKYMIAHLKDNFECLIKQASESIGSLATIANMANAWGADLVISPHMNAGGGDGYESVVYSKKSKELAEIFNKHVKAAGQNIRPIKYRSELKLLRLTDAKAIICEGAFVDNKKDIRDWNDDAELKKLGVAYAKAAAEYLKLPKKVKKVTTKKTAFKVGETYTLQANMKVRAGAGTGYRQKKRSELTESGRANSLNKTYAVLKKGTKVTCKKVSGNWVKIPSGWICGKVGKTTYLK